MRIATLHSNWTSLTTRNLEREGVHVEYVGPMHVKKHGSQKQYYSSWQLFGVVLRATWALSKAALSAPVDIIHVGKPHPMNSIAGLLAARLKGSALCVDCDDYEAGSNRFGNHWQQEGVAYFEKRTPRHARLVTTNTLFMKSNLLNWGCPPGRIFYLSNGIESERFITPKQEEVDHLRDRLGLNGKRIILYLGSLSLVNHPVDLLLIAFKKVSQESQDVALLIVGGGEDYQALVDMAGTLGIRHLTYFAGRVEPTDVPKYYALADVSVDPVNDDDAARGRSPLKLFESWVCGVPFVTSPVGDREYLLGQPPAGVLAQPAGDSGALANGLLQILKSSLTAAELQRRGSAQVQQFTWDRLAKQLEQEYLKLL